MFRGGAPQAYRPVEDRFHLGDVLLEYLEEYNVEFPSQMHLVFFADAVAHVRCVFYVAGKVALARVGLSFRRGPASYFRGSLVAPNDKVLFGAPTNPGRHDKREEAFAPELQTRSSELFSWLSRRSQ